MATGEARGETVTRSSAQSTASAPALYALIDRRRDGRPRIVATYVNPEDARQAAILMRWAGDPVEIVLLTAIRDDEAAT